MNVVFSRIPWDAAAAAHLAPAMAGSREGVEWLRECVGAFLAVLVGVYVDGARTGSMVLRFEWMDGIREMVVVAVGGTVPGRFAVPFLAPDVLDLARQFEADQVRTHTRRPGVARWLEGAGFYLSERRAGGEAVYRATVM